MLALGGDGRLVGSVSGGCIEDDLVERMRSRTGGQSLPETVTYGVSADEARRFGLPCGGTVQIVLEPLRGRDRGHFAELLRRVEGHQLVTRSLHVASGAAELRAGRPDDAVNYDGTTLTTVFGPRWRLLLIGAGQLSTYVARMAQALDYHVLVCDPREEYVHTWDVPGTEYSRAMPDDTVLKMVPDCRTAVVALTHDPKLDDMALLEALKSDAFYVGALGSAVNSEKRRKRLALFDLSGEEIARLHGPIGIPIGSHTPPEIAVSLLAEITAVRNGIAWAAASKDKVSQHTASSCAVA
jgi:xanthine dehydrogenase accessory factor